MSISTSMTAMVKREALRGLALASLLGLAACQQMPSKGTSSARTGSAQPAAQQASTAQQPAQQSAQQSAQQPRQQAANNTTPNITFHLAQVRPGNGLAQVQLNQNTRLYAVPQPVLTQADLRQIVPMQNKNGQVFLRFDFNQQGAAKLAKVTREAQGNYLIISAQGKLISVPKISATYDGGSFPLPVASVDEAQAISRLIRQPAGR
ncbi:SecDF P1 head subdomain-containing protein [Bordetella genomosp. 4]|uniref:SecDF P1 head subdomain domain-containing protein n=1 Tax=Bordetella genomosp. 4 TaxID=463044 RepID=A0A261U1H4_9BORD|nr:hypothetical protein [Bordetella genomosp. 4]OZI51499.1 hypothetical protein CAL21_06245 [Bordetella genomosp. 4]OZI54713.1 hypothetical protein CAL20_17255 [Bordetella genomosp. 4]